jgi:ABC-type multidrug transport system fused ATPase/permease subunit
MFSKLVDQEQRDVIRQCARVLTTKEKRKFIAASLIQVVLGIVDLVAIGLVGILGTLAITGISGNVSGERIQLILNILQLQNSTLQVQVAVIGIIAALLMTLRTLFSVFIVRRVTYFLSRRGAMLTSRIFSRLLNQEITTLQRRKQQEILYGATAGVDAITLGILNTISILTADLILLVILGVGLFALDWVVALTTFSLFGGTSYLLYRLLEVRAREIGFKQAQLSILSNQKILEVLNSYRELVVRDRRGFYADQVSDIRMQMAHHGAEKAFMPNITKYVLELTLIYSALIIAASQFLLKDATHAVGMLSIFLAASSRMSPAVLRVQQSFLVLKGSMGAAKPTLELLESVEATQPVRKSSIISRFDHPVSNLDILVKDTTFSYPDAPKAVIEKLDLHITHGMYLAIVGPSGSGKTTLVDLILGILEPQKGEVTIGGKKPIQFINDQPGMIAYVPQDVVIINGSIRENISMGFESSDFTDSDFERPIQLSQLKDLINELPLGLDSDLGDNGSNLSGGQRQRIGIARALFTNPRIIILDEATSSLDGSTEASISESLLLLRGEITVIIIAHRLSSIMKADEILYIESGKVIASGDFNKLRTLVPNFDTQASFMEIN